MLGINTKFKSSSDEVSKMASACTAISSKSIRFSNESGVGRLEVVGVDGVDALLDLFESSNLA